MFCKSKLLICFHAVAFFSIRVISAMYTNHIDARSLNVDSDIGKRFYMTLLLMILIMIVNIWELLKYWIDSRKKEFYIRRIVGADKKQIMILFLLDYIGIMIISVILGIVLSFIFYLLPLSYSEAIWNVHKGTLWISMLSCLIPMLMGSVIVWRQQSVRNFE